MTCYDREPARSTMDLPLETAAARMRDLQGEIARSRVTDREHDDILHRLRATVGHRLIALGSSIAPAPAASPGTSVRTVVSR